MTALTARRVGIALVTVAALTAAACGGDDDTSAPAPAPAEEPAAEPADEPAPAPAEEPSGCAVGEVDGDLNLYNWSEYIDPELKTAFEAEYGVSVTEDNYDSNEAMQPIVAAGNSGYDVIVPSDYMVTIMIEEGTIQKLNKAAIPNFGNLDPNLDTSYDPTGEYVAPYQGGTTGLGVNLSVVGDDAAAGWGLVFDPAIASKYAGQITLLNDPRETLGAALKYLGYSLNTTDDGELAEAKDLVAAAVENIAAFESDQYDELLTTGESVIAHGYSGNVVVSIDEYEGDDEYAYFVPSQGGTIWTDNMAVPFDAPHPCTAHTFINFILDADNGAQLSEWNYYASPNARSNEVMDPEVREVLAVMYPDDLSGLEYITDTGDFETNFSDAFSEAKG